jgi:predicted ATPase
MAILDLSSALRAIAGLKDASATETRWLALTGAPVAGKSSILNVLERRGHLVHKEQARAYMLEQIAAGKTL